MEQTLQALGGILLKSIPTIVFLLFLLFFLKGMLFGPLERLLLQRDELTAGARKAQNFLNVLIDRKRILELDEILVAMEQEFDRRTGAVTAEVSSPLPLSESQRETLETQLSLLSGRKARLKFVQDPSLIGGLVAKVGSTVYDGSVKGQLAELRRRLAAQG